MRRLLATAALLGVALFATACADVPQPEPGSPTGPPTTQAQGKLDDKLATCSAWNAARKEVEEKSKPHLEAFENAQADPLKAATAYGEVTKLLNDYKTKSAELEAKAADAEVKAALKEEVAAVGKLQSDLNAAGSDPAKIQAAIQSLDEKPRTKLEGLCK